MKLLQFNIRIKFGILLFIIPLFVTSVKAQTERLPSPWDGKYFDSTQVSPIDSLRIAMHFNWETATTSQKENYLKQLQTVYPDTFNMEWVQTKNVGQVQTKQIGAMRYVINDGITIELEKRFYPHGFIFYVRDGVFIPEMRFYRLLTKYHPEQ